MGPTPGSTVSAVHACVILMLVIAEVNLVFYLFMLANGGEPSPDTKLKALS